MANHTFDQYKDLMPFVVEACNLKGLMESDSKLIGGVASWLFMFKMSEELTDVELDRVHRMFWDAFNERVKGQMPSEMRAKCIEAVNQWTNINVTIGGDIDILATEMWESIH